MSEYEIAHLVLQQTIITAGYWQTGFRIRRVGRTTDRNAGRSRSRG